jgi:hypothetical protein
LPDRIGIGVPAKVFTPEMVDRVIDEVGVRKQRKRVLPARVVVYVRHEALRCIPDSVGRNSEERSWV